MNKASVDPILVINLLPKLNQYRPLLRAVLGVRGSQFNQRMAIFRTLVTLGLGFYGGVYAAQNYEVPKADDPAAILQKLTDYFEQYKKDKKD